jgi:hypothetical protein
MKTPARGKRAALSLLVRPEIKRLVDRLATANGITQSAQAELLIEQGVAVRQVLDTMNKTLEEIERSDVTSINAALWRRGYRPWRETFGDSDKVWTAWCEPGHPRGGEISAGSAL